MKHSSRIARTCRGFCTLLNKHWSWTARINISLWVELNYCRAWVVRIDQANSAMVGAYWLGDKKCGMRASTKRHHPLEGNNNNPICINRGVCALNRQHRSYPSCINLYIWFNVKQHHIKHACMRRGVCTSNRRHIVVFIYWQERVSQRLGASTNVLMHLTWFVHIWKATSENDTQHHPKICMHNPWHVCTV